MATLGHTTIGSLDVWSTDDTIIGSVFTATENGTVSALTFATYEYYGNDNTFTFKGAIYKNSDGSLVGSTDELQTKIPLSAGAADWKELTFSTQPSIVKGTEYIIVIWCEASTPGIPVVMTDTGSTNQNKEMASQDYSALSGEFPSTFTSSTSRDEKVSIYITYTAVVSDDGGGGVIDIGQPIGGGIGTEQPPDVTISPIEQQFEEFKGKEYYRRIRLAKERKVSPFSMQKRRIII